MRLMAKALLQCVAVKVFGEQLARDQGAGNGLVGDRFGAVALDAAAVQTSTDGGDSQTHEREEADVGEPSDEVRKEEDRDSGVEQDKEDAAQRASRQCTTRLCASRHDVPPNQEDDETCEPRPQRIILRDE